MIKMVNYCLSCQQIGDNCDCGEFRTVEKRAYCDMCCSTWYSQSGQAPHRCPRCRSYANTKIPGAAVTATPTVTPQTPAQLHGLAPCAHTMEVVPKTKQPKSVTPLLLPADLKARLKAACEAHGVSMTSAITQMIEAWLGSLSESTLAQQNVTKNNGTALQNTTPPIADFIW